MQHPFAGVDVTTKQPIATEGVSRRQALGRMIFSTAGVFGATAAANGQIVIQVQGVPIQASTDALNEEGGRQAAAATTAPFGEEAGKVTSFVMPGLEDGGNTPTTEAVNEEGGKKTLAVKEEGVAPPLTRALNENGVTTNGLNEEGGIRPVPRTEAVNEDGIKIQPVPQPVPLPQPIKPIKEEKFEIQLQPAQAPAIQLQPAQPAQPAKPILVKPLPPMAVPPPMATTLAIGEEGGVTRARFEEGGANGGMVVVPPMTRDLQAQQLDAQWLNMGNKEEGTALQACAIIYGSKQAIDFLKGKLKTTVKAADTDLVARLIKDLDNDSFEVREKAAKDLTELGVSALPALQEVMGQPASAEVHARIRRLLEQSKDLPAYLQMQRGVEVLVALNNDQAKALLTDLSKDKPATLVTALATQALPRMK